MIQLGLRLNLTLHRTAMMLGQFDKTQNARDHCTDLRTTSPIMVIDTSREGRRFFANVIPTAPRISGTVLLCVFAVALGCEKTVAPVTLIVLRNGTQDSIGYYAVELRASALSSQSSSRST